MKTSLASLPHPSDILKKRLLLFCWLQIVCLTVLAQTEDSYGAFVPTGWEQMLGELWGAEDNGEAGWEEAFEVLGELEQHPLNLNTATREDLERIPFLTDTQIEDLCAYIYQYGGMKSLGELSMIASLDYGRRRLLPYFVYVESAEEQRGFPSMKTILKHGSHELLFTGKIPFYERHGDQNGYLGYPYRHALRYGFHYGEYVQAGLTGAQDAGEPFFAQRNNWGYDHYSFYVLLRKMGRLKTLAVGRYRLRLGMGLVMNTDFGFGKMATLETLGRQTDAIRGSSSRSAANYLQGAAATVTLLKGLDLTAFVSSRKKDGTLTADGQAVSTIVTTGYHRTETEMNKKHNFTQSVVGGHLAYGRGRIRLGLTALHSTLDKPLQPNQNQQYRRYYATGDAFWNAAVDYAYVSRRLSVSGETATGNSHGMATVNRVSWQPVSTLQLLALQRFYSYRYTALFAQSFSEGGAVQNESGLFLGFTWQPLRRLTLTGYGDYAYFAWPKYQAAQPSQAWDMQLQATYRWGKATVGARYRFKTRERDNDPKTALIGDRTQRGRLSFGYELPHWTLRTQLDGVVSQYKQHATGWMASQEVTCRRLSRLQLTAQLAYFHTDDYQSRIYLYERQPLYQSLFPAVYGKGVRATLFIYSTLSAHWLLIGKLGTTDYFDRDHISSGLQQIDHSSQTDLEIQLRLRW